MRKQQLGDSERSLELKVMTSAPVVIHEQLLATELYVGQTPKQTCHTGKEAFEKLS